MTSSNSVRDVALVIGGSGGLGRAICRSLAATRHVRVSYRGGEANARAMVDELRSCGAQADSVRIDLQDKNDLQRAFNAIGEGERIATLVYAAGADIQQKFFSAVDAAEWRDSALMEIEAFFNLMHAALPALRRAKGASVIAVTTFATTRVVPGDVLSAVPKAGIEMLVRQIAREEGRFGIRVNAVAPGVIDAGIGGKTIRTAYTPEVWEGQRKKIPLQRFGSDRDIASAVSFLASESAAYVTGQTLTVDGGMSL